MIENLKQVDAFKDLREASYELIEKVQEDTSMQWGNHLVRKEIACVVK